MKKNISKIFLISILAIIQRSLYAGKFDLKNVVKSIPVENIDLDSHGNFKNGSLAKFLERAHKIGKLSGSAFENAGNLEIKDMVQAKKGSPWATSQLFSVKATHYDKVSKYVVREVKDVAEVHKLINGSKSKLLEPFIDSKKADKKYPLFIFPTAYLSYKFKDKEHWLLIMHKAKGQCLSSLITLFKANPNNRTSIRLISKAYYDLGTVLSRFYKNFGDISKTIIQGDLHHGNIFYDIDTRQITLIDNDRVEKSLKEKCSITTDLEKLLLKSLFVTIWTSKDFLNNFLIKKWYSIILPNFLAGFLSTYKENEIPGIFKELKRCITASPMYIQRDLVPASLKSYLKPILQALENSRILPLFGVDCNIKKKYSEDKTLLHLAAKSDPYLIHPLIRAQIDVNVKDKHNNVPLHEAAYFNNIQAIEALIDARADINAQDCNGDTPLHKAICNSNKEVIAELIHRGADIKKRNNAGKSCQI